MKRRTDHLASFKDPAAKVFFLEGEDGYMYRELSADYLLHYNHFKSSGLADELVKKNWLVPFEEGNDNGSIVLKANKISFVSYPYEWTFTQWKDAALLTLKIQYQALKHGMVLKDATPFNIVFEGSQPFFVDLSSFEIYKEGQPWQAFKQFSENFYVPVLLAKYFDSLANAVYLNNINGITVAKGISMLPAKAYFNFNTLFFLALPGRIRSQLAGKESAAASGNISLKSSMQFAQQLFLNIDKLKQKKEQTKWNDYYNKNIEASYLQEKEGIIKNWIGDNYQSKSLIDFGCNTGNFSTLLANQVATIIAFDEDMRSVDELYRHCKEKKIRNVFCFTANLSQPTPATGWDNTERSSLKERLNADLGLALALIHHLVFSNHIRFNMSARFFADTCKELIIEFIPKSDPKVQLLLNGREDIFSWYTYDNFITAFRQVFNLSKEHAFSNGRVLLHFSKQ